MAVSEVDLRHLRRCVELAGEALDSGAGPFGAMLIGADGHTLHEDRNRVTEWDLTRHPEFAIARWAAVNLAPEQRVNTTVYTSCEQCPMCAAAHGWAGLGRIVYATSATQLSRWLTEWGVQALPVAPLPVTTVVPDAVVDGPVPSLEAEMKPLYRAFFRP
ncbi:nucleoside deaminase [Mycobacterium sp.]|uniref:nucleoside deaminase n=1 Tax=Mycobacterium sp. TaxID=1785 RepID=UPI0031E09DA2